MKRFVVGTMAAMVLASSAQMAMAQSKTVRSEMRTDTAVVEAVEASTRTLTLKKADGSYLTTVAGPDITRFSEVKIGDTVNVRYYENVIVRVKRPGEPDVVSSAKGTTGAEQALPGGTKSQAGDDHGNDYGHRSGRAVDHVHRPTRLEVLVEGAGHGSSRQGEGRRQGRHRLDGSDARVGRAQIGALGAAGAVRRDRPGLSRPLTQRRERPASRSIPGKGVSRGL